MYFTTHKVVIPALFGIALALGGCSKSGALSDGSKLAGESTFDPKPADPDSIAGQLKRYKGQTQFLTPYDWYMTRGFPSADASAANRSASGGARTVQESDIFKIGKPGSKLLFLLNNYRGLQVVTYEDGADQPKLLGRVDATGNWPDTMYFDAVHDRLIVLENNYIDESGDYYNYSELQSRLVVYDVANPAAPKITHKIDITGSLSESRMVGDVLYIATSVRPDYYSRNNGTAKSKGFVYSYSLSGDAPALVDQHTLAAPVSWGEKMNIVETQTADGKFQYRLIAALSKDEWSWWDRQSLLEVVDISDEAGKIKPIMVVNAKGFINERSQTSVKNDTLVVASNYQSAGATPLMKVAVETFKFPTAQSEQITTDEAQFRKLNVEHFVAKKENELKAQGVSGDALADALAAYRTTLLNDAELGLAGRFVQQSEGVLMKPLADSTVTVGNTQGLNATVQDVRFHDNLLYVYWVPANNIDPLDLFDVSAPELGVKHLSHLEFDGWIQRAIPVTVDGKSFVMGLGWIVPAVNNDNNRRYPQAMLFEIVKNAAGQVKAEVIAQKNLGTSSTWVNFQAEDKMIETRFTTESSGAIMYTFASWDGMNYLNGGKLIGFDLKKAATDPENVFVEGGVLNGSDDWLRRVFTNSEIDRVNTFADTALGTFDLASGIGAANAIVNATNILELARNVRGYLTLTKGTNVRGVQIVSDYAWWNSQEQYTELRLVKANRADAEAAKAINIVKLPGSYVDNVVTAEGNLLVLTQSYNRIATDNSYTYENVFHVNSIELQGNSGNHLEPLAKADWKQEDSGVGPRLGWQQRLIKLASGRILAATGSQVKELQLGLGTLAVKDVAFGQCDLSATESAELKVLEGKLFVAYSVTVKDPVLANVNYNKNFLAPVTESADAMSCAAAINIPGKILTFAEGHAVTQDTRLIDIKKNGTGDNVYYTLVTEQALTSLKLAAAATPAATLVDLYDPKDVSIDAMKVFDGDQLLFIESTAKPYYGFRGRMIWDDMRGPWSGDRTENRFVTLGFDTDLEFTKTAFALDLPLNSGAQLTALFPSPKAEEGTLAVVSQGNRLQVLAYDGVNRPVVKQLRGVDANFRKTKAADYVTTKSYWYWSYGDSNVHFTPSLRSLELPEGYAGVTQVYIEE